MANACLAEHGHAARIDHRSHAERGIALEPQNKIGPNAARRARRGEASERVEGHHAIAQRNGERVAGHERELAGLTSNWTALVSNIQLDEGIPLQVRRTEDAE